MDWSVRAAIWIIATATIAAVLYLLRDPLTQFALALILWLAIDGLAQVIDHRVPFTPRWLALPIALVLVLSLAALLVWVIVTNLSAMMTNFRGYEIRLNEMIAQAYGNFRIPGDPPTMENLMARLDPTRTAGDVASGLRNVASDIVFILIYLAFLFPASAVMGKKFDYIFGRGGMRAAARDVINRIQQSMERYLWVQTVISLIITTLTYVTLLTLGLPNALFWSFLIFFLNFIPTIGSVAAVVLTTLVALVQFPSLAQVGAVALGVSAWQFIIGNFLQPRLTSQSLNLSAVVMLLALSIWGAIWGITGAFLAAPLTTMLMIVLAQFPSTRWIAILLSADGKPTPETTHPDKSDSGSN
ncbi:MAG TPA: AI-2E family transporter [Vitreimonas sp.]|jgi:predicted PurR-regulated permease PerM|nr:AI-2E family transporter [Vitreimonas sp.]